MCIITGRRGEGEEKIIKKEKCTISLINIYVFIKENTSDKEFCHKNDI
jgi:hypothetical protein